MNTAVASLASLASRINAEHEAFLATAERAIDRAVEVGRLLCEARAEVPEGRWIAWVESNCSFGERQSQRYFEIYSNRQLLTPDILTRHGMSGQYPSDQQRSNGVMNTVLKAISDEKAEEDDGFTEKQRPVAEYYAEHPAATVEQAMDACGASRGTTQKVRDKLGISNPRVVSKAQKQREKTSRAYHSVQITNGPAVPLGVRLMERPVDASDEAWLASLPARSRVAHPDKFDADALIVRHCKPRLQAIKDEIERLIGLRSPSGMTPLHRALHRVFDLAGAENWRPCESCEGGSRGKSGSCRDCNGTGYVIPNFTRGTD
jgi:hypothetical protein